MPYLAFESAQLFYQTWGERRAAGQSAVVLLHGLGSAGDDWPLQVPPFSQNRLLLAPDALGHGRSSRPPGPLTIRRMAEALDTLLDRLNEPPAHLVGLSLGGCIALQTAIDNPQRVRSLVLVNAFARLTPAGPGGALRFARRLGLLLCAPMESTARMVARGLFPKPEQREFYEAAVQRLASNSRRAYLAAIRALLSFDARPQLGQVRCPTLVVAGDRDQTIPMAAKVRLHEGIPGSRLVVIPDSGHATAYDQAAQFNTLVLEFINSVEAQPPG